MIVSELKMKTEYKIPQLQCTISSTSKEILEKQGILSSQGYGRYLFSSKTNQTMLRFNSEKDEKIISDYFDRKCSCVAVIEKVDYLKNALICSLQFFYREQHLDVVEFVLSTKVIETLKDKQIIKSFEKGQHRIVENFTFYNGFHDCFALSTGDFQQDKNDSGTHDFRNEKHMKIYGKNYDFLLSVKEDKNGSYLWTEKVLFSKHNLPAMMLAVGRINPTDQSSFVSHKVQEIMSKEFGYLELWEQYSNQEGEILLNRARKIGLLKLTAGYIIDRNHIIVHLIENDSGLSPKELKNLFSSGDALLFSSEKPSYLENPEMTWKMYSRQLSNSQAVVKNFGGRNKFGQDEIVSEIQKETMVQIIKLETNGSLHLENKFSDLPYVSLSILGQKEQIKRREMARLAISNGNAANPVLELLINGNLPEELMAQKSKKKIPALSHFVKEKIFKQEPSSVQLQAIDIALNTPDIAVIQGPPGTGKTTIISAIIERLNELSDKNLLKKGEILITSFQHTAVRNVADRLTINSLPTIKYGNKGDLDLSSQQSIDIWCEEFEKKIEQNNPSLRLQMTSEELFQKYKQYTVSPTKENAQAFLKIAEELNHNSKVSEEISRLKEELVEEKWEDSRDLLIKIRKLRVSSLGFLDDGKERALDLLDLLVELNFKSKETKELMTFLETVCRVAEEDVTDDFLKEIRKIKFQLLKKCAVKKYQLKEIPRKDVCDLYQEIKDKIKPHINPKEEILFHLLKEIKNNYGAVADAISSYNYVFAATTQQSLGRDILKAKSHDRKNSMLPSYETVIIDEAARVNPGDLMIPLAQARRRIILVGDHRQLPHIFDEEVFEYLQENTKIDSLEKIETTMFQHLMKNAKKLAEQDGITRTVTLNIQYRMHPLLAGFISDNFYKKYQEEFTSLFTESHFQQNLEEKSAVWAEIPHHCGETESWGSSKIRVCEAEYIVKKIEEYFRCEGGTKLSYGVISFYSGQVRELQKRLERQYNHPEFAEFFQKVQVGTVDSFQGVEHDVIFLSVVRTERRVPKLNETLFQQTSWDSPEDKKKYTDYMDRLGQKQYGFLTSENRLCVALSRQKKLLVVVGNSEMFHKEQWGLIAEKTVPALKNLYELCKNQGVILYEKG